MEQEKLKGCTFQPNIEKKLDPKSVKGAVDRLYQDGVSKKKTAEETKQTEEIPISEYTFAPKVNPL
jgi:hypothetical protein